MTSDNLQQLLTVPEGARLLGLQTSTLRRWIWERRIRSFRIGRAVRLRRGDLLALLEESPPLRQEPIGSNRVG